MRAASLPASAVFSFSPAADALQIVRQIEQRGKRDQLLRLEDADHVLDHLLCARRTVVVRAGGAGQQIDHAILRRDIGGRMGRGQQRSSRPRARRRTGRVRS